MISHFIGLELGQFISYNGHNFKLQSNISQTDFMTINNMRRKLNTQ